MLCNSQIKFNNISLIIGLFYSNLYDNFFFLVKQSNNIIFYIKALSGLFLGDFIIKSNLNLSSFNLENIGLISLLRNIKKGSIISNISYYKFYKKKNIISSSGTYGQILKFINELNIVLVKLPSGKKVYFSSNLFSFNRRNAYLNKKYQFFAKAGYLKNYGKNSIVRGVAMNPVDHPHGGRTKTNSPEVSIWGWVTKFSH